ncbi:MAG: hypothetical protein RLZZ338_4380, partial [Cyanobacteriota bacterium]
MMTRLGKMGKKGAIVRVLSTDQRTLKKRQVQCILSTFSSQPYI